ncbi:hypothetical protein TNCV_5015001 [Trichonephila clavipes]|nr:hypothetical protein TNCV_5015001 [Trichonephila clavipes]
MVPPTRLSIARLCDKFETEGTIKDMHKRRSRRHQQAKCLLFVGRHTNRRHIVHVKQASYFMFPSNLEDVVYSKKSRTVEKKRFEIEAVSQAIPVATVRDITNNVRLIVGGLQFEHLLSLLFTYDHKCGFLHQKEDSRQIASLPEASAIVGSNS